MSPKSGQLVANSMILGPCSVGPNFRISSSIVADMHDFRALICAHSAHFRPISSALANI